MVIHPVPKPTAGEEPVLPDGPAAMIAGAQGIFKVVRNPFYTACVKLDALPSLADLEESAELHVPALPCAVFQQVEAFFAQVYEQYRSEAVVLLYCNPARRQWRVTVPPQEVRGLHVTYSLGTLPEPPAGFTLFGTIHSHANIKAFHSGTDDTDEACFDGLHITVGDVDKPVRSYACRWILAGKAFPAELAGVVETPPLPEPAPEWMAMVKEASDAFKMPFPRKARSTVNPDIDEPELDPFGERFATHDEYLEHLEMLREEIDARLWEAEDLAHQGEAPCCEEPDRSP